jgi:uncharacterized membrane protein YdjX (TVP38/TMEM64 family)
MKKRPSANSKKKFYIFLVFVLVSIIVFISSGFLGFNENTIQSFLSMSHTVSALTFTLLFIALTTFSFSVSAMTSLGALLFPWQEVIIYSMIGILGSSIIDFYISRKLGRNYIQNYLDKRGGKIEKFDDILEKNPAKSVFILSTIFFVPPTIPNFLGGITNLKLKKYIFVTFLGNLPNTFLTVYLIDGILKSNPSQVYFSTIALVIVTTLALYFYSGEIREIVKLSIPRAFKRKH